MENPVLIFSDESELLDKMPLVMKTAIAVDINMATFQKIALFQVKQSFLTIELRFTSMMNPGLLKEKKCVLI